MTVRQAWLIAALVIAILVAMYWNEIFKNVKAFMWPKTWDHYTNKRIQELHPSIRNDVAQAINELDNEHGLRVRIGKEPFRSFNKQNELYAQGRSKPGDKVTWVKGGFSYHNYGLAVDLYIIENGKVDYAMAKYETVAQVMKKHGFQWGYDLWNKDKPHFHKTFGKDLEALKAEKEESGVKYPELA